MYIFLKHLCTPIADGGTEHDYSVWQFVTLFVFSSLSGHVLCHLCGVCADLVVYCWVILCWLHKQVYSVLSQLIFKKGDKLWLLVGKFMFPCIIQYSEQIVSASAEFSGWILDFRSRCFVIYFIDYLIYPASNFRYFY